MAFLNITSLYLRVALNISLLIVEIVCDKIVLIDGLPPTIRAIFDSCAHGIIAALSWAVVVEYDTNSFQSNCFQILICGILGAVLDIDHFIAARSFSLKDALNLSSRPPFHNTSFLLFTWLLFLLIWIPTSSWNIWNFSWILLVSGLSHHLRDAVRRGLWFHPFGSTRPLPYWGYLCSTAILPHVVRLFVKKSINAYPVITV